MVGTGPYQFVAGTAASSLTFEEFDDYWGEPRRRSTPAGRSSRTTASGSSGCEAGDYDIIEPTPQFVSQLEGNENICFDEAGFLLEPLHLSFNLEHPTTSCRRTDTIPADFFHDMRVRQAFNYAFDYEALHRGRARGLRRSRATYLPPDMLGLRPERAEVRAGSRRGRAPVPRERLVGPGLHGFDPGRGEQPDVRGGRPDPEGLARELNPNFRVNVVIVPEARFDEAHGRCRSRTRCGSRTPTRSPTRTSS